MPRDSRHGDDFLVRRAVDDAQVRESLGAMRSLQQRVKAVPDDMGAQRTLAATYLHRGRFEAALRISGVVLARDASDVEVARTRVRALLELGRTVDGVEAARTLAADQPLDADVRSDLALAELAGGDVDAAAAAASEAEVLRGDGPSDPSNLTGLVALRRGNWAEAEACYRRVLLRDGRDLEAANNLAIVLATQRKRDDARMLFTTAHSLARRTRVAPIVLANLGLFEGRMWAILQRVQHLGGTRAARGVVFFGFIALVALATTPLYAALVALGFVGLGLGLRRRVMRRIQGQRRGYRALPFVAGVIIARRPTRRP